MKKTKTISPDQIIKDKIDKKNKNKKNYNKSTSDIIKCPESIFANNALESAGQNINDCTLCNVEINDTLALSGIRIIKNNPCHYKICSTCFNDKKNVDYSSGTTPIRNKMWSNLNKKLRETKSKL